MNSSYQSTPFHSYSSDMEGPGNPGNITTPNQIPSGITLAHQFLYLQVKGEFGLPLAPALFAKDVIAGMFITQGMAAEHPEPLLNMFLMSNTEVILEISERANIEKLTVLMTALEFWLEQKVRLVCRTATPAELDKAKDRDEDAEGRESLPETQDA